MQALDISHFIHHIELFVTYKERILSLWLNSKPPQRILKHHDVDMYHFRTVFASGVFDYFIEVAYNTKRIGKCPLMHELLEHLKYKDISADELLVICNHFRKAMLDFSFDQSICDKTLFNQITYLFDTNFEGVLKQYTDTIFQKEQVLAKTIQKLTLAQEETKKAIKAKDVFFSSISHEIRTPLNAILGFVSILQEENNTANTHHYLTIIKNSGHTLLSIINDILDFTKLEDNDFSIKPALFLPHDNFGEVIQLFQALCYEKHITLDTFINPHIPRQLFGDILRIKQIIANLLSNAIKFSNSHGNISVFIHYEHTTLIIKVQDNGIGIKPENLTTVFKAFSQVSHSEDSTGLGLAISQQLAQHMRGVLEVSSTFGQGSTFTLSLPLEVKNQDDIFIFDKQPFLNLTYGCLDPQNSLKTLKKYLKAFSFTTKEYHTLENISSDILFISLDTYKQHKQKIDTFDIPILVLTPHPKTPIKFAKNVTLLPYPLLSDTIYTHLVQALGLESVFTLDYSKEQWQKKFIGNILVAEDNHANQELIIVLLKRYGINTTVVSNGQEAIDVVLKNSYDLVFMDQQMPIMTGASATQKIKTMVPNLPIIEVSANASKTDETKLYDGFLQKPIDLLALEKILSIYLQKDKKTLKSRKNSVEINTSTIDIAALSNELNLDYEEIIQLLTVFFTKSKENSEHLLTAAQEKDYATIEKISHSIKGSASNFRFSTLEILAKNLEEAAANLDESYDYVRFTNTLKETIIMMTHN